MDRDTAARAVAAAQRDLTTKRTRYNRLARAAARRRRVDPAVAPAKEELDAARTAFSQALDDWNKTQQRPRYTAPR